MIRLPTSFGYTLPRLARITIPSLLRILRLQVKNDGNVTARKVTMTMTKLEFGRSFERGDALANEVLDLKLALSGRSTFDIPPKSHRWVDLIYAEEFEGKVKLRPGFARGWPARLPLMGFGERGSRGRNCRKYFGDAVTKNILVVGWLAHGPYHCAL
jgi:hypothetical protein